MNQKGHYHGRLRTDVFKRSEMMFACRPGTDEVRRYFADEDWLSCLQCRLRNARLLAAWGNSDERVADPCICGIPAENSRPPSHSVIVDEVNDAKVRQVGDHQLRKMGEGVLEIESGGEHLSNFRNQSQLS